MKIICFSLAIVAKNSYLCRKIICGYDERAQIPYRYTHHPTKEGFYEYTLYLIFSMLNVYVRTQVKVAGGRVDMVVLMPDTTYVLELKMNGTAQEAMEQINSHSYALPYETDGRRVVKAGISFSLDTRTVGEWVIADC